MRSIEIVSHCYSEQHPVFASLLTSQLSSLWLWPPEKCRVLVVICTTTSDKLTRAVGASFADLFAGGPVDVQVRLYEKSHLFRRAIARNFAAKMTTSDIVWFADADYLFGQGCLDNLAAYDITGLSYPRQVLIHKSHRAGDVEISRIVPGEVFEPDLTLFQPQRVKFAIGGLQIVPGAVAREKGYLDHSKWIKPVDPAKGFQDTREDKSYRAEFKAQSVGLNLPRLMRFRHSQSAFEDAEKRLAQTEGK